MSIYQKPHDSRTNEEVIADAIEGDIPKTADYLIKQYRLQVTRFLNNPNPYFNKQAVLDRWGTKAQAILAATSIVEAVAPEEIVTMPPHVKNADGSITLLLPSSSSSESSAGGD